MRIDQDDFLKSFLKKEANKPTETYTIDQKQFELIDETQNYISGSAVFETGALLPIERKAKKDQLPGDAELKTLDELFDEAHGESVLVADHPIGGLVENQKEQHQRMLNSIYRMPSGVGVNVWAASVITDLTKIASELDDAGLEVEASQLDSVAEGLLKKSWFPGWLSLLAGVGGAAISTPGLVVIGLVAGGAVIWSLWDGMKEDLRTDINDLYDKLADFKSDSDYTNAPGLSNMIEAVGRLRGSFESLNTMMGWSDEEFANQQNAQQMNKVVADFEKDLSLTERNFQAFETASSNKNPYRKFFGFSSLGGHIESVRENFSEWLKVLHSQGAVAAKQIRESAKENPEGAPKGVVPPATRPPGGSISEVKKYLLDHDVSNIIGRKYEISEGPELDDGTRVVLELLAAEIRKDLGTRIPTTSDLINTTYNGMDQMMSIYLDPYKYMEE